MKRMLDCYSSDFLGASKDELKSSIAASDGRIIMAETVVTAAPLLEGVSNPEVMGAFGADMILLNEFDLDLQEIVGFYHHENPIEEIKKLTGCLIGINLEPIDEDVFVIGEQVSVSSGRRATKDNFIKAEEQGVDFIVLTGNPSTGVSNKAILQSVAQARKNFLGLIFAGKMHSAGLAEEVLEQDALIKYIQEGADGVLIPTVGTVPGLNEQEASQAIKKVHALDGLVISTIGTSQESADEEVIRLFGLSNKRVGSDIHHIGDGAYGRMPTPENILQLGITVRGKRHTYFRMSQSVIR